MHYISDIFQERMNLLGLSVSALSEDTFVDEDIINDIISNRRSYEDVDEFDMALLCSRLHCDTRYFIDKEVRNRDLLIQTKNEKDSVKSNNVKATIQDFISDATKIVADILNEKRRQTYEYKCCLSESGQ